MNKTLWLTGVGTFLLGLIGGFGVGPLVHNQVREAQFAPIMKMSVPTATLLLSNDQGGCTGKAKQARHEPSKGLGEPVWGCWLALSEQGVVQVVFTDGEGAVVPMMAFERVEK